MQVHEMAISLPREETDRKNPERDLLSELGRVVYGNNDIFQPQAVIGEKSFADQNWGDSNGKIKNRLRNL